MNKPTKQHLITKQPAMRITDITKRATAECFDCPFRVKCYTRKNPPIKLDGASIVLQECCLTCNNLEKRRQLVSNLCREYRFYRPLFDSGFEALTVCDKYSKSDGMMFNVSLDIISVWNVSGFPQFCNNGKEHSPRTTSPLAVLQVTSSGEIVKKLKMRRRNIRMIDSCASCKYYNSSFFNRFTRIGKYSGLCSKYNIVSACASICDSHESIV